MASVVDIVNLALSHLGDAAQVTAISPPDGTTQASHGGRFYPIARDLMLEAHPWSFATVRVPLAQITGASQPEWAFSYALPSKYLRGLAVLAPDAHSDAGSQPYKVEAVLANGGRVLYTNVERATLRYIQLIEDTTKFTPGFVTALARLLASYLAGPIIKGDVGAAVSKAQMQIWVAELGHAKDMDSDVGHSNEYRDRVPDAIRARGGHGARGDRAWR
ncbi:hypothetical protein [Variovorax sp.]|uniref:hypothetical protein n=1 Tax=Variovorax sp. TaxID=1871043 RepID=UPI003BAC8095